MTSYCANWKAQTIVHKDGTVEKFDWIVHVDECSIKCSLCKSKPFSITSGGISCVRQHANGAKHHKLILEQKSQKHLTILFKNWVSRKIQIIVYKGQKSYKPLKWLKATPRLLVPKMTILDSK